MVVVGGGGVGRWGWRGVRRKTTPTRGHAARKAQHVVLRFMFLLPGVF